MPKIHYFSTHIFYFSSGVDFGAEGGQNVEIRRHFSPHTIQTIRNAEPKIQGDCKDTWWSNNLSWDMGKIRRHRLGTFRTLDRCVKQLVATDSGHPNDLGWDEFLFLVFIEFPMTKILGIQLLPHHRSENYRLTCMYSWAFFSLVWNFTQLQSLLKKIVADFQRFSEIITRICIVFTTFLSSIYRNLVIFLELLSQKLVIFGFN